MDIVIVVAFSIAWGLLIPVLVTFALYGPDITALATRKYWQDRRARRTAAQRLRENLAPRKGHSPTW